MATSAADPRSVLEAALSGRYTLKQEIGRGGMGVVYEVRDERHHRPVAMKVLTDTRLTTPEGIERFLSEIRTTASLSHPNIVPLLDSGHAGDYLYYLMPLVEGESLQARLGRQSRLPVQSALRIARDVAGGLAYAHRRGVVHRDVKPGNILLTPDDRATLADFGLARAVSRAAAPSLTRPGLVVGTPAYMSPEQAAGLDVDARADIYALGMVIYETLTGDLPDRDAPRPPIESVRADVSLELGALVDRALEPDPEERFRTAEELEGALEAVGRGRRPGTGGGRAPTPPDLREPARRATDAAHRETWPGGGPADETGRDASDGGSPAGTTHPRLRVHRLAGRVSAFLSELRRRKVYRATVGYAVFAFVVWQVADILLPALNLPEWSTTLVVVLTLLGFPVAWVLSWAYDLTPEGIKTADEQDDPEASPAEATPGAATPQSRGYHDASVAVLPFVDLTPGRDQEYLADGIAEALIGALSRVSNLRVAARTSSFAFKGRQEDLRKIARDLGVSTVLEGGVRKAPDRLRVTVQLADARTGYHLWSETYDREPSDIFQVQDEISRAVAERLRVTLLDADEPAPRPAGDDIVAYDLYLRGRYLWNKRTEESLRHSLGYFRRALAADEGFTPALAGLADAYVTLALYGASPPAEVMPRAREAAERALTLDAGMAEAQTALACVRAAYDWEWEAAEKAFARAIELNPAYPTAHQWYAVNLLAPMGRFEDARAQLAAARAQDPLSLAILTSQAVVSFVERDYRRAAEELEAVGRRAEARGEPFALARYFLGQVLSESGKHEAACRELERALDEWGPSSETLSALGHVCGRAGKAERARELLATLGERSGESYVSPVLLAQVHIGLGQVDRAFHCLEKALELRAAELIWLRVRPVFDPIRDDRRYTRLLAELGLPPGSRAEQVFTGSDRRGGDLGS